MPGDEQYRAWVMRQERQATSAPPPELRRATLTSISGCPAQPGFRELYFDVGGTAWSWCFPGTAGADSVLVRRRVDRVIFRPGPHGLVVTAGDGPGDDPSRTARLELPVAADLAAAGVPVFVHRSLIGR